MVIDWKFETFTKYSKVCNETEGTIVFKFFEKGADIQKSFKNAAIEIV